MGLEGSKDMDNVKGYIYFWITFQTINTTLTPIAVREFLFSGAQGNTEHSI